MPKPRGHQRTAGSKEPKLWETQNLRIVGRACDRYFDEHGMPRNSGGLRSIIHRHSMQAIEAREKGEQSAARRREAYIERVALDLEQEDGLN